LKLNKIKIKLKQIIFVLIPNNRRVQWGSSPETVQVVENVEFHANLRFPKPIVSCEDERYHSHIENILNLFGAVYISCTYLLTFFICFEIFRLFPPYHQVRHSTLKHHRCVSIFLAI
jgi:hypothetical protein